MSEAPGFFGRVKTAFETLEGKEPAQRAAHPPEAGLPPCATPNDAPVAGPPEAGTALHVQVANPALSPCAPAETSPAAAPEQAEAPAGDAGKQSPCGPEGPLALSTAVKAEATAAAHKLSFLRRVGESGLGIFHKVLPFLGTVGEDVEPGFDLLFPMCGPIFNMVVRSICMAQMASKDQETGELRLQAALHLVGPQLTALAEQHALPKDLQAPTITRYINAVFDLLDGPVVEGASGHAGGQDLSRKQVASAAIKTAPLHEAAPVEGDEASAAHEGPPQSNEPATASAEASAPAPLRHPAEIRETAAAQPEDDPWANLLNAVVDLSWWNEDAIFERAIQGDEPRIEAILHKATEGTYLVDSAYAHREQAARAQGRLWGAYHFGVGMDGAAQADFFLQTLGFGKGEGIPAGTLLALDVEKNREGADMELDDVIRFVKRVQQQTGIWSGIYGGYYLNTLLRSNDAMVSNKSDTRVLANCWLWWSRYRAEEPRFSEASPWRTWALWQYTDGKSNLIAEDGFPRCDRSFFAGSRDELRRRWLLGTLNAPR